MLKYINNTPISYQMIPKNNNFKALNVTNTFGLPGLISKSLYDLLYKLQPNLSYIKGDISNLSIDPIHFTETIWEKYF